MAKDIKRGCIIVMHPLFMLYRHSVEIPLFIESLP